MLTVTPCGRDLCVDLQPPVENLRNVYESLHYKFQIRTNGVDNTQVLCTEFKLKHKVITSAEQVSPRFPLKRRL